MKLTQDNILSDFCCESLDKYTKTKDQCVKFDPFWKDTFVDREEPRLCIFQLTGSAIDDRGMRRHAGGMLIPIKFCPFCGVEIEFSRQNFVDEDEQDFEKLKEQHKVHIATKDERVISE